MTTLSLAKQSNTDWISSKIHLKPGWPLTDPFLELDLAEDMYYTIQKKKEYSQSTLPFTVENSYKTKYNNSIRVNGTTNTVRYLSLESNYSKTKFTLRARGANGNCLQTVTLSPEDAVALAGFLLAELGVDVSE